MLYTFVDLLCGDLPWRQYATGEGKNKETVLKMKIDARTDAAQLLRECLRGVEPLVATLQETFDYVNSIGFHGVPDYDKVTSAAMNVRNRSPALQKRSSKNASCASKRAFGAAGSAHRFPPVTRSQLLALR